ncbi:hypothetical protein WR25_01247 [Diploscapter pachys]|uniref:Uncharacterized protein n=1 Tax=Diploscapter pachys TaxID=2018661 RepID=A0A2A2M5H0_9BILA|nr:hypothetical protein WR25_01247 [Diploscapter pachys]
MCKGWRCRSDRTFQHRPWERTCPAIASCLPTQSQGKAHLAMGPLFIPSAVEARRQEWRDIQRQRLIVDNLVQQHAGNRRGQNPGTEMSTGVEIPWDIIHRPENRQLIR